MGTHPVRTDLPPLYVREIGRITFQWALLEWRLKQIIYGLLGINPKQGRVAVREQQSTKLLATIVDLLTIKRVAIPQQIKTLRSTTGVDLARLESHRNWIAHGIWVQQAATSMPVLQVTRGEWQPVPGKRKVKRILEPEGLPLTVEELRELTDAIKGAIRVINELASVLKSAPPAMGSGQ